MEISVKLPNDLYRDVSHLAQAKKKSVAEIIKNAVRKAVAEDAEVLAAFIQYLLFSSNQSKIYTEDFRFMIQTVEAVIDKYGKVQLLEQVNLLENRRALVTILEEPGIKVSETALLSETRKNKRSNQGDNFITGK